MLADRLLYSHPVLPYLIDIDLNARYIYNIYISDTNTRLYDIRPWFVFFSGWIFRLFNGTIMAKGEGEGL